MFDKPLLSIKDYEICNKLKSMRFLEISRLLYNLFTIIISLSYFKKEK